MGCARDGSGCHEYRAPVQYTNPGVRPAETRITSPIKRGSFGRRRT